ncbi:DUF1302 domain-containing protein [Marinospirillum minutulum]|uniref:DUF1302 domain-containing protein n=1 Tax=Marinospirillum minutulum TaxID=64974 RepID=UPI0004162C0C|nr:DUF1302 domain-containing protein [Marinospirillum minutulum]
MSKQPRRTKNGFTKHLPRLSVLALAIAGMSQVHALDFAAGDFNFKIDSKLTLGSSWRMEKRNNDYIAAGTLAEQGITPGNAPGPILSAGGQTSNPSYQGNSSSNTDDGNMNFDKGDAFSQVITGNHTLGLTHNEYRNVGAKVSFRYWYDHALSELDGSTNAGMIHDWKNTTAFDDAKSGIELMDAYIWGEFDVAGRPAQAILGRHVLNWGQSSFIQGGQNAANPIDVQALRRPGATLKDALLPVTMLSGSIALDEMGNFNLEGYYQLEWQRTRADACGTYFSNSDFAAEGCGPVYFQSTKTEQNNLGELVGVASRLEDNEPSDTGQYGIALKWYAEQLNGTEFGISYQNVHSRLPMVSGRVSTGVIPSTLTSLAPSLGITSDPNGGTNYRVEFPEDQKIISASFATLLPTGTAWSGEFTYRPDTPIQINANDVLVRGAAGNLAALKKGNDNLEAKAASLSVSKNAVLMGAGLSAAQAAGVVASLKGAADNYDRFMSLLPSNAAALGTGEQKGYEEKNVFQFQSTFIHDINRVLAADNLRLIGEVGFTYVDGLPDTSKMRFGRSSVYGSYGKEVVVNSPADAAKLSSDAYRFADNGYVTDLSWGYRLVGQLEYTNALISGLTLKPTLSWSHDVSGYGPEPGSQFYEGRMILGTALAAEYMNTYTANLSYTNYFDTDYWDLDDRDFVSLNVGVNF